MKKFKVTYFYWATGEHETTNKDYGIIEAESENDARDKVANAEYPVDKIVYGTSCRDFFRSCLRANEI